MKGDWGKREAREKPKQAQKNKEDKENEEKKKLLEEAQR